MNLWAIVPVKPLKQGKSRLSGVLSEDERYMLTSTLLGNTLRSLSLAKVVDQILVVSRDSTVLAVAREFKAKTVQEETPSNLNQALSLGTRVAVYSGAQRVLVLPADLPLLSTREVEEFVSKQNDPPHLVIAPDRRRDGTNAMLVSPANAMEYQFGPGSYQRHMDQAVSKGIKVDVYLSRVMELDLDLPEDLEMLKQIEIDNETERGGSYD
jgi:2-phospho-L-lactate/phosphoenolpyruvate guanylyltransferase